VPKKLPIWLIAAATITKAAVPGELHRHSSRPVATHSTIDRQELPVRHTTLAALGAAILTAALTACGGSATAPVSTPTTVTVEVPAPTTSHQAPAPAPAAATASSWTMPNLVGAGLQEAQDSLQALTDYGIAVTTSHDAAGAGRMQVSDRNWKVCSQSVAPGATITSATPIDFGAVKLEEDC
jgi:hypothetical protein